MALISSIFEDTLNPVFSNIFGVDGDAPIFNPASIAGLYFSSALSTGNVLFSSVGTDPRELQQGYAIDLNGTNQYGDLSDHIAAFASKTRGRITGYIKTTTTAISQIIGASDKSDGSSDLAVRLTTGGEIQLVIRDSSARDILWESTATVNDGAEHSFDIHMTATGLVVKIDGVVDAGTFANGNSSTVAWFNDVADLDFLAIGVNEDSGGFEFYYDGVVFDLVIYDEDGTTELLNIPTIEKSGATAYDVSGNGYHITWVNSPAYVAQNVFSYANTVGYSEYMYFDGVDDYISLDSLIDFDTSDFFVTAKIIMDDVNNDGMIFGKTTHWVAYLASGAALIQIREDVTGTTYTVNLDSSLENNTEYEITVRRVGTELSVDIDGVKQVSTQTCLVGDSFSVDQIGSRSGGVNLFQGVIFQCNINNVASYLGDGNLDENWVDQIGSNNGTVVGSPSNIFIPALTDLTADAAGGTLQHQGVAKPRAYADGNSCISLNGSNQYGDSSEIFPIQGSNPDFTIAARFNTDSLATYQVIVDGRDANDDGIRVSIDTSGGLLFSVNEHDYNLASVFSTGTDYCLIASHDGGGRTTVFINGVKIVDEASSATTLATTVDWLIGRIGYTSNWFFSGTMFDVEIFDEALSDDDAIAFSNGSPIAPTPIRNIPISEGAGTTSYDKSGNNDITWVNAPTWSTQDVFAANFEHGFSLYEHATLDPLRVPYGDDGSPLTITPPSGYTKTSDNPPILGHNDFEGTLDFVNTSVDRQPVPETARIDAITTADISAFTFGMSITSDDNVFYRAKDSVTNDRLTIYEADLTGADLAKLLKYTNDGGK